MTVALLYVPDFVVTDDRKKATIDALKSALVEGLGLREDETFVILERFGPDVSNKLVSAVFFPIVYLYKGTSYERRKYLSKLVYNNIKALYPSNDELKNMYMAIKEHDTDNYAVNGDLTVFDAKTKKRLQELLDADKEGVTA